MPRHTHPPEWRRGHHGKRLKRPRWWHRKAAVTVEELARRMGVPTKRRSA